MRTRTKTCPTCGGHFSYEVGKGTDRRHCGAECRTAHKVARSTKRTRDRRAALPVCKAEGCGKKATRVGAGLCEACYCQLRRTGGLDRIPRKGKSTTGAGYVKLRSHDHPLACSKGWVMEHRAVLYALLGDGPLSCFWCGMSLTWPAAVVDHLNENKQDNRAENLAVSCNNCNRARGSILPFIERLTPGSVGAFIEHALAHYERTAAARRAAA